MGVVLCHLTGQTQGGMLFRLAFTYIGPLCVAGFFFLSGYGSMTKYQKKGTDYLRGFLPKRLLSVWIPLVIVALILVILKLLLRESVVISDIADDFFHGIYLVPYSGFIITLSFFYILFYIGGKMENNGNEGRYGLY